MFKVLRHVQKRLVYYLPLTMLLAIIYGNYFDVRSLKTFTPIIVFFMVYPMMIVL
ncbi:MAG: arsenic resistance protein, partial [Tissierellia bacterium]|nr:arsenic resistance protein [Tissierellia bacterium]